MGQVLTSIADLLDLGDDAEGKDIDNAGTITAVAFVGDGSGLTGMAAGSVRVTSVALTLPNVFAVVDSRITSSGTFAVTFATQSANRVFAGPTIGSAGTPPLSAFISAAISNIFEASRTN